MMKLLIEILMVLNTHTSILIKDLWIVNNKDTVEFKVSQRASMQVYDLKLNNSNTGLSIRDSNVYNNDKQIGVLIPTDSLFIFKPLN